MPRKTKSRKEFKTEEDWQKYKKALQVLFKQKYQQEKCEREGREYIQKSSANKGIKDVSEDFDDLTLKEKIEWAENTAVTFIPVIKKIDIRHWHSQEENLKQPMKQEQQSPVI